MKSNDQTTTNFITPIILNVASSSRQTEVAISFIQEQFGWNLNSTSPQLKIINSVSETISIETIRDLINELAYASHLGKPRAFVLLSADQLSIAAQHAILKSLEEPPINTLLLLVSSVADQLLTTIQSRCISYFHQSTIETIDVSNLSLELKKILIDPTHVSYTELIKLATKYKDKNQALQIIHQLIIFLHQQQIDTNKMIKIQQQLLTTLDYLQANTNVRLTLENCFFALKKIF